MTAVLPQPAAVSDVDQLRRENTNLRRMVTALLGALVHRDVHAARENTDLAQIAAASRDRHTRHALNTITTKQTWEQP